MTAPAVVLDFSENFTEEELCPYRVKKSKAFGAVGIVRVETRGLEERDIQEGLCAFIHVGGARAALPSTSPHRRSLSCLS